MKRTVTTLALAAILAGTSHAAIIGKKPDFMDKQQLAGMRAEAASNSIKETEDAAFFTGRPYLASSGEYAFKYRSYKADIGRWTSEDPSGFPDGANNSCYAPVPSSELDLMGLWRITLLNPGSQSDSRTGSDNGLLVSVNYYLQYSFDATASGNNFQIGGFALSHATRFNTQTGIGLPDHTGAGQSYATLQLTSQGFLIASTPAGDANTQSTASGGISITGVGIDGTSRVGSITVQVNAAYNGVVTWNPASGLGYTPSSGADSLTTTHTFNFEVVE